MVENKILIDYDCIFDTDFGLIRMIKNERYDKLSTWNNILNANDLLLIQLLVNREEENPLSIITTNEFKDQIDIMYNQFINRCYKSVLKYSCPTEMLNLMKVYKKTGIIDVSILCKNLAQEQDIEQLKNLNFNIINDDISDIDISSYDSIYLKYFKDALKFKSLIGKNLYIANYKFNLNDDNIHPKDEISIKLNNALNISIIDIYNKEKFLDIKG